MIPYLAIFYFLFSSLIQVNWVNFYFIADLFPGIVIRTQLILFFHYLIDIDECASDPCQNGGICLDRINMIKGYTCRCTPGWTGPNCERRKKTTCILPIRYRLVYCYLELNFAFS